MKKASIKSNIKVPGFTFSGISAGIKQSKGRDLALILSDKPAAAAAVFTKNKVKAAPVKLAIECIGSRKAQAIIINSGNANACTGQQGLKDAKEMNAETAKILGIPSDLVYVSSTGVIGRPLPMNKIINALSSLKDGLSPSSIGHAADAIMTTDTYAKLISKKIKIGSKTGTVAAIAKGSGMICPDMATMLCFIVTDISLSDAALDSALREAVDRSFNVLSVDNDMSTNDTVMIMANGVLGNNPITIKSSYYQPFKSILNDITYELAKMIAVDGEGATKLIEVIVKGSRTESDAQKVAKAVSRSMLVRTAIYGRDPNWGRLLAATGYSGAEIIEQKVDIFINKVKVVNKGLGTNKDIVLRKVLASNKIVITIDLGIGSKTARALSCDLTEGYIKINAHYGT